MHISTILYWFLWILWGIATIAGLVVSVWGLIVRISSRTRVKNKDILKFSRKTFDAIVVGFASSAILGFGIASSILKENYFAAVIFVVVFAFALIFAWASLFLAKELIIKLQ